MKAETYLKIFNLRGVKDIKMLELCLCDGKR